MTIAELITELQKIEDQTKAVFIWVEAEIYPIQIDELPNRVELMANYAKFQEE